MKIFLTCIAILVSTQSESALRRFSTGAFRQLSEGIPGESSRRFLSSMRAPQTPSSRDIRARLIMSAYLSALAAICFEAGSQSHLEGHTPVNDDF